MFILEGDLLQGIWLKLTKNGWFMCICCVQYQRLGNGGRQRDNKGRTDEIANILGLRAKLSVWRARFRELRCLGWKCPKALTIIGHIMRETRQLEQRVAISTIRSNAQDISAATSSDYFYWILFLNLLLKNIFYCIIIFSPLCRMAQTKLHRF